LCNCHAILVAIATLSVSRALSLDCSGIESEIGAQSIESTRAKIESLFSRSLTAGKFTNELTMHQFCLVLTVPTVTDDQINALYSAGLDGGTVSTSQGVSRIDVSREADSLETAIRSAIGQVSSTGLAVARVEIEADQIAAQPAT
jgi:hypothetical protein